MIQSNETSGKMHKDKIGKLQTDLNRKVEEVKKLKARVTVLKTNVHKLEQLSKHPM